MIIDFFSGPVGIAAILSFFIGSFGYVLLRMWVLPLFRYRLLKSRVRSLVDTAENLSADAGAAALPGKEIRKTAAALSDCCNQTLPQWYQLVLANRDETPDTAVAGLMALANVKDRRHVPRRIAAVRAALRIPPPTREGIK